MTVDAQTLLDDSYTKTQALQSAMQAALAELTAVTHGAFFSYFDIAGLPAPAIDAPDEVSVGTLPTMKTVDFRTNAPVVRAGFSGNLPQLQSASLEEPGADTTFDDSLINEIQSQFGAILSSGGSNISAGIQQAVFDQGHERTQQIMRDALDLAGARTGAKGCRYPNSMTKAMHQQIITENAWQRSDLSRQIMKTFGDLVQGNLQAAMSAGANIAAVKADLAAKIKTLSYESKRLAFDKFRVETENNFNTYKGQLESMLAGYQVEKLNYELTLDYQAAEREYMRLQATENMAEFDAANKNVLTKLEADKIIEQLRQEYERTLVEKYRVESGNFLERGKAQVQQVIEENKLKIKAIEELAKSYISIAQTLSIQGVNIVTKKT